MSDKNYEQCGSLTAFDALVEDQARPKNKIVTNFCLLEEQVSVGQYVECSLKMRTSQLGSN